MYWNLKKVVNDAPFCTIVWEHDGYNANLYFPMLESMGGCLLPDMTSGTIFRQGDNIFESEHIAALINVRDVRVGSVGGECAIGHTQGYRMPDETEYHDIDEYSSEEQKYMKEMVRELDALIRAYFPGHRIVWNENDPSDYEAYCTYRKVLDCFKQAEAGWDSETQKKKSDELRHLFPMETSNLEKSWKPHMIES